jgi:hypothetical protein
MVAVGSKAHDQAGRMYLPAVLDSVLQPHAPGVVLRWLPACRRGAVLGLSFLGGRFGVTKEG